MLTRTAPVPLSYVESWTYDGRNNPLTYVDGRGNTTSYIYDNAGRLLSETRPGGVTTSYTYNADGTVASVTDPRGGVTAYTYDGNGNVLSSTTPLGFKTTYTYDAAGRVLTVTEPRGNVAGALATNFQQKFTYDAAGNVLTAKDALNRTTTNVYDAGGRRTHSTNPDGGVTVYGYNAANELVSLTAPDGGVTLFEYDVRGLKVKETSPVGAVTTYGYDPAGRLVSRVDPRGNVAGAVAADFTWTYAYDGNGRLTSQTDPLGRQTTMVYDPLGRLVSTTRPEGTTTSTYDANGNATSQTTPAGTSSSTFDGLNRMVTSTDPRGKTSSYTYDAAGNQLSVTDPLGRVTSSTFDADGRRTSMVDPRGNVAGVVGADYATTYSYDEGGRQTSVRDPLGNVSSSTYDRVGNVLTTTNPRLQSTGFLYDSMNRVTRITSPVVGPTNYTYSTMGNVLTRADPLSTATAPRVSSWTYDLAGRVTKRTDPLGRFATSAYDVAGNIIQTVDANANAATPTSGTTTFTYDRLNRPVSKLFSDSVTPISWTYDAAGRRASMTDSTGTRTYGYDGASRVTSITKGGDVFSYTYDQNGNVLSRGYPDGRTVAATFDDANQMATVNDGGGAVTFSYDPAGNPAGTVFPNGVSQTRTYDRASRITGISNAKGVTPVSGYTYTRDANGNPTIIDVSGPAGIVASESQRNTFDNADRLTKTCFTTTTCTASNQTVWTYDKVGNRLTEKIGSAAVSTYTYDTAGQLTAIAGPGAASFTYNANGDMLTAGADTYTYNVARLPASATVGGVASQFVYDGNLNRAAITTAGVTTTELVDTVGGLPTLVAQRNSAGAVLRQYTYGRGLEALRYVDNTQNQSGYYLTDVLGSVTDLTNSTGGVVATYRYTPYGAARASTLVSPSMANNPLKYTGQQQDPGGFYNLRARHYNPALGRFTQTDPLEVSRGESYPSPYVYAGNNPLVYVDPSGLRADAPVPESFSGSFGSRPGWGKFAVRAFISTAKAGCFGHIDDDNCHKGDGRSFSSAATCEESRACAEIDFDKGTVTGSINFSCRPSRPSCKKPDQKRNKVTVTDVGGEIRIRVEIVNPFAPEVGGLRLPSIDASLFFKTTNGPQMNVPGATPVNDSIETKFNGDAFPSWEVYANRNGGSGSFDYTVMRIKERAQMLGLPVGLLPAWPNHKQRQVVPQVRH